MTVLFCWSATAQNGVTVSNLDVKPGTVTFNVSWNNEHPTDFLWSDSVWVFVDYNKNGVMTRLPVTSATATAGTVTKIQSNDKGVWVIGNARSAGNFSATVQLLTATADLAGVCAYASNYPPVGEYTATNKIKFTGTPEYDIVLRHSNGTTDTLQSGKIFLVPDGDTLKSFSDKTGAPGVMKAAIYTLQASALSFCEGSEGIQFAMDDTEDGKFYQLYRGGAAVNGAVLDGDGSAGTFSGSYNKAGTYTARTIADKLYYATVMNGTPVIVENPLPVLLSSGSVTQIVDINKSITDIIFTAADASITLSSGTASLPAGVSGTPNGSTFTISGTPSTAGTFNYSVTAAHSNGGCTSTLSGAITVKATTPTYAASTQTWTVSGTAGAQIWSAPINIPACNKASYSANNTSADCRNNPGYGYLYSWTYVKNNQSTLCNNGWRVPTSEDFCTLDKILYSTTTCNNNRSGVFGPAYISTWGGAYGGYSDSTGGLGQQGEWGYYWTLSEYSSSDSAYDLRINGSRIDPLCVHSKFWGFQVRCVK
jgi:uncharacterized protein (TIGR02145 family)